MTKRIAKPAEAIQANKTLDQSPEELRQIIQNLHDHQIELQMQNDELRRTQQALDTAKTNYFDLYNLSPVGYCTLNEAGLILEANLTAATLLGVAKDELTQQPIIKYVFKEDQDIFSHYRIHLIKTSAPQSCELRMVNKDGAFFWVQITTSYTQCTDSELCIRLVISDITERKKAEDALRQSEMRFRSYFNLSLIGIAITSVEKGWLEVNERLCEILGYSQTELELLTWVDITHPDDIDRDVAEFQRVLRRESDGYSMEKRFISKDGKVIHAAISVSCVSQDNGQIDYFVALVEDITERKQVEEKLRISDQALKAISQGVVIVDVNGCIISVNSAFTSITGYSSTEAIGQNCRFLQGLLTDPQIVEEMRLSLRNVIEFNGEILNYRKDGTPFWNELSISPLLNEQNQLTHYIGVIRDISVRKQIEVGRDEALGRLQKIASRIPGLVFQYRLRPDGSSCIPFASEALREIYGISPEDVLFDASPVFALVHPEDFDGFMMSIQQSAQSLSPWHHEFRVKFDDGTVRWVLGSSLPQRETDGSTLWHGYVSDISERKHNEQQLREFSTHLEAAREEERSRIAREIHDQLGSILTALKMDLSWLRKKLPIDLSSCRDKANAMDCQLNEAFQTVRDIATDLRPSILDHLGLLAAIDWQMEKFNEQTGVKTSVQYPDNDIAIDEKTATMIFRIVQEALTNIARHAKAIEVQLSIAIIDTQLLLTINDNGCGMSQTEMNSSGKYGILGMHERAGYVGGTIKIESSPGAGTQIELRIPHPFWTVKHHD